MKIAADLAEGCPQATDGDIAVFNLRSAWRRSWSRFSEDPHRAGVAELIVEQESQLIQFLSDFNALDRLEMLVTQIAQAGLPPARRALVEARVAAIRHCFGEARRHLAVAENAGAEPDLVNRLALSIDQACGVRADELLATRRRMAAEADNLEELLPLGALLTDLNEFTEADEIFRRALRVYSDVSPFALAQVCFHLGLLWGEVVPDRQTRIATWWYRKAIEYVPCYTKARIHLAEIQSSLGQLDEAEALLTPMIASSDPEVRWRLADVLFAEGERVDAEAHSRAARSRFEELLGRHPLAFADHGAEFFAGSGDDPGRALELARLNVANRPTPRAFELAHAIALSSGDTVAASALLTEVSQHWGGTAAYRSSPLAQNTEETMEGTGTR